MPTARSRILSHALAGAVSGNLSKWFWDKELNTFCPRPSWGTTIKLPKIQNVMYNFALPNARSYIRNFKENIIICTPVALVQFSS
jgi:hypothetical protein